MLPFLPLIIGAGLQFAGGLIQQGSQRRAEEDWNRRADAAAAEPQIIRNEVDLQKLRDDAEAAGFNPLTVLRNGGIGGYNVQHHPNLHPLPNVQHGVNYVGSALQGAGSMVASYDYGAAERQAREFQLMDAQIANLSADTAARSRASIGGVPAVTHPGWDSGGGEMSPGGQLGKPSWEKWEEALPSVTNPVAGDWWESNPYFSDVGSGAEERYGDFGAIPWAIVTQVGDVAWNVTRGMNAARNAIQSWHSQLKPVDDVPYNPYSGGGLSLHVGGPNHGTSQPVP